MDDYDEVRVRQILEDSLNEKSPSITLLRKTIKTKTLDDGLDQFTQFSFQYLNSLSPNILSIHGRVSILYPQNNGLSHKRFIYVSKINLYNSMVKKISNLEQELPESFPIFLYSDINSFIQDFMKELTLEENEYGRGVALFEHSPKKTTSPDSKDELPLAA